MNAKDWELCQKFGFVFGDDEESLYRQPRIIPTQDLDTRLKYPNYREQIWNKPQVIYGREESGLEWVYSDRLWQWDRHKAEAAQEQLNSAGLEGRTARYVQEFLRLFYDTPNLELICVMGGVNLSSGYEYYVYGYRAGED